MIRVPNSLFVLLGLLAVPFALRPPSARESGTPLIVLTPHNEAIRYEFGRAFRREMKQRGRDVRLDFRTLGGTTEITRYLNAEFKGAFALHWTEKLHRRWNPTVSAAFDNPKWDTELGERGEARRAFLASQVGVKVDVLFGGGSFDFTRHAAAGRLVDAGLLAAHPELFGKSGIPQKFGGETFWDAKGRWLGTCVSGFGICYNPDSLSRLGVTAAPAHWSDLASPSYAGELALADPTKSGSANKAFEMLVQEQMATQVSALPPGHTADEEALAIGRGFDAALRIVRKLAANARYFTDSAVKIPLDVAAGNAAAGMCIDFYGRFQSESSPDAPHRLRFVTPEAGTSFDSDPIGLLRGAPSPDLARQFMAFVLSPSGQALWGFKRGVAGGPERYALRRLPILPALYRPEVRERRSDPEVNPYQLGEQFVYHPTWTGPLFRALSFVIHVMCVDTEDELHAAWSALIRHGFPVRARARFEDVELVSYANVQANMVPVVGGPDPLAEMRLQTRLVRAIAAQYREVSAWRKPTNDVTHAPPLSSQLGVARAHRAAVRDVFRLALDRRASRAHSSASRDTSRLPTLRSYSRAPCTWKHSAIPFRSACAAPCSQRWSVSRSRCCSSARTSRVVVLWPLVCRCR